MNDNVSSAINLMRQVYAQACEQQARDLQVAMEQVVDTIMRRIENTKNQD